MQSQNAFLALVPLGLRDSADIGNPQFLKNAKSSFGNGIWLRKICWILPQSLFFSIPSKKKTRKINFTLHQSPVSSSAFALLEELVIWLVLYVINNYVQSAELKWAFRTFLTGKYRRWNVNINKPKTAHAEMSGARVSGRASKCSRLSFPLSKR